MTDAKADSLLPKLRAYLSDVTQSLLSGESELVVAVADALTPGGNAPLEVRRELAALCAHMALDPLAFYSAASKSVADANAALQDAQEALRFLSDDVNGILRWSPLSELRSNYPDAEVIAPLLERIRAARLARSGVTDEVRTDVLVAAERAAEELAAYLRSNPDVAAQLPTATQIEVALLSLEALEGKLTRIAQLESAFASANFTERVAASILTRSDLDLAAALERVRVGETGDELTGDALVAVLALSSGLNALATAVDPLGTLVCVEAIARSPQEASFDAIRLKSVPARQLGDGRPFRAAMVAVGETINVLPAEDSWFWRQSVGVEPVRQLRKLGTAIALPDIVAEGTAFPAEMSARVGYVVAYDAMSQLLTLSDEFVGLTLPARVRVGDATSGRVVVLTLLDTGSIYYAASCLNTDYTPAALSALSGYVGYPAHLHTSITRLKSVDYPVGVERAPGRELVVQRDSGSGNFSTLRLLDTGANDTSATGASIVYVTDASGYGLADGETQLRFYVPGTELGRVLGLTSPRTDVELLSVLLPGSTLCIGTLTCTVVDVLRSRPRLVGEPEVTAYLLLDRAVGEVDGGAEVHVLTSDSTESTPYLDTSVPIRPGDRLLTGEGQEHLALNAAGVRVTVQPAVALNLTEATRVRSIAAGTLLLAPDGTDCFQVLSMTDSHLVAKRLYGTSSLPMVEDWAVCPEGADLTDVYEMWKLSVDEPATLLELDALTASFTAQTPELRGETGWSLVLSGELRGTSRLGSNRVAIKAPPVRPFQWSTSRPAIAAGVGATSCQLTVLELPRSVAGDALPPLPLGGSSLYSLDTGSRLQLGTSSSPDEGDTLEVKLRATLRGSIRGPIVSGGAEPYPGWAYLHYRAQTRAASRYDLRELRDDLGRALVNLGVSGETLDASAELVIRPDRYTAVLTSTVLPALLLGCDLRTSILPAAVYVPIRVRAVLSTAGSTHVIQLGSPAPELLISGSAEVVQVIRTPIASAWAEFTAVDAYLARMAQALRAFRFTGNDPIQPAAERLRTGKFFAAAEAVESLDFRQWVDWTGIGYSAADLTAELESVLSQLERNRESPL